MITPFREDYLCFFGGGSLPHNIPDGGVLTVPHKEKVNLTVENRRSGASPLNTEGAMWGVDVETGHITVFRG